MQAIETYHITRIESPAGDYEGSGVILNLINPDSDEPGAELLGASLPEVTAPAVFFGVRAASDQHASGRWRVSISAFDRVAVKIARVEMMLYAPPERVCIAD